MDGAAARLGADDAYGAFTTGAHDDLVTALGLAMQPILRWRVVD